MTSNEENRLRVAIAQINLLVGDIEGNVDRVLRACTEARDELRADLVVFPELTLTGYPPEDLLLRPGLHERVLHGLEVLKKNIQGIAAVVGFPHQARGGVFNAAGMLQEGNLTGTCHKQHLPNYSVFDEKRYFSSGDAPCVTSVRGVPVGITICEDVWSPGPVRQAVDAGARLILNLNASPFHIDKGNERELELRHRVEETAVPIVYVNLVGGQDELVFDGESFVVDARGEVSHRFPAFASGLFYVDFDTGTTPISPLVSSPPSPLLSVEESAYKALVVGVRDYVDKNGFRGVVIGLSGGIDSALTLAVAVDAIGADRVEAVMLPSRFTADMSIEDAREEAEAVGVEYHVIPIEPAYQAFLESLADEFAGTPPDTTEENMQARCRVAIWLAVTMY